MTSFEQFRSTPEQTDVFASFRDDIKNLYKTTIDEVDTREPLLIREITHARDIDLLNNDTSGKVHIILVYDYNNPNDARYATAFDQFSQHTPRTEQTIQLRKINRKNPLLGSVFVPAGVDVNHMLVYIQDGDLIHTQIDPTDLSGMSKVIDTFALQEPVRKQLTTSGSSRKELGDGGTTSKQLNTSGKQLPPPVESPSQPSGSQKPSESPSKKDIPLRISDRLVVGPDPIRSIPVDLLIEGVRIKTIDTQVYSKDGNRFPDSWEFGFDRPGNYVYLNGQDEGFAWFDRRLLGINLSLVQLGVWVNASISGKDGQKLPLRYMIQGDPKGIIRLYVDPSEALLEAYNNEAKTSRWPFGKKSPESPTPSKPRPSPKKPTSPEQQPTENDFDESVPAELDKVDPERLIDLPRGKIGSLDGQEFSRFVKHVYGMPPHLQDKICIKVVKDMIVLYRENLGGFIDYRIGRVAFHELENGGVLLGGWTAPFGGEHLMGEVTAQVVDGTLRVSRHVDAPEGIIEYDRTVPKFQQRPTQGTSIRSHINIINPDGTVTKQPGEKRKQHQGVDIDPKNSLLREDIKPTLPGTVVYVENSFGDNKFPADFNRVGGRWHSKIKGKHGNYVIIQHPGNVFTLYAHLKKNSIPVSVGDKVGLSTVIGKMGNSGTVHTSQSHDYPGKHLHLEYFRMTKTYPTPEAYAQQRGSRYKKKDAGFVFLNPAVYLPRKNISSTEIQGFKEQGSATWYELPGNETASGEMFDKDALCAAHFRLPFGTRVKVTNLENNTTVIVRINDRGPFDKTSPYYDKKTEDNTLYPHAERKIDLTPAAFKHLAPLGAGVVKNIKIEVVE